MDFATAVKKLRSQLPYALDQLCVRLSAQFWTLQMLLRFCWWQVNYGRAIRCYGPVLLRRHPTAAISIGHHVVFRSKKRANPLIQQGPCGLFANKNARIEIGDHCGLSGATLVAHQQISIGKRVLVGANVLICDSDHHPLAADLRASGAAGRCAPIRIDDDVWLGANVVVLKGVHIGAGAVVAANALVCQDVPPGAVVAGVPALVVGHVEGGHAEVGQAGAG